MAAYHFASSVVVLNKVCCGKQCCISVIIAIVPSSILSTIICYKLQLQSDALRLHVVALGSVNVALCLISGVSMHVCVCVCVYQEYDQ